MLFENIYMMIEEAWKDRLIYCLTENLILRGRFGIKGFRRNSGGPTLESLQNSYGIQLYGHGHAQHMEITSARNEFCLLAPMLATAHHRCQNQKAETSAPTCTGASSSKNGMGPLVSEMG